MANDRAAIAKRPGPFPTPAFQAAQASDPRVHLLCSPKNSGERKRHEHQAGAVHSMWSPPIPLRFDVDFNSGLVRTESLRFASTAGIENGDM